MAAKPKGKFRGVRFYKISHKLTAGRRLPTHALPFNDKGAAGTDLGKAPRTIEIEAILLGPDHRSQRDDLISALEEPGAAIVEHPDWGRLNIYASPAPMSESVTATNATRVRFRGVEAFDQPPAVPGLDTASALKAASAAGRLAAAASFANNAVGMSGSLSNFVDAANISVVNDALNGLRKINNNIAAVLAAPGRLAAQIDAIAREVESLLNTPAKLFSAIDGVLEQLAKAAGRLIGTDGNEKDQADIEDATTMPVRRGRALQRAIAPMADLVSGVADVPDIDTQERRDQAQDQRAIKRHFRAAGLLNLAAVAADLPFDSSEDAGAVRDALSEALLTLSESEPDLDAPLAAALKETASLTLVHLAKVAGEVGAVVEYTPQDTLPIEVVAHALYGDAERADEIVLRNPEIEHPSFVTAKTAINVKAT